ncbi:hypothetical protein [Mucilaginibacter sp. BT774]|uniref:hypothetical protein n=1 Tax=Mucilaginibacter sp. BT774 TaxID=3062276 RepID=UPI002674A40B|nr:hypothetical protein [Mucilaginibacter sp. BT774]MDO3624570.1 hypothetical protein [Mucilaginibacter sp. BT774]
MMKLIASILTLYFGLLMMQPFYHMSVVKANPAKAGGTGMCCKKMERHIPVRPCNNTSACNTDFCNPFVPCGISVATRVIQFKFSNPALELSVSKKPAVNDHITSNYLSDCWRPPRLS